MRHISPITQYVKPLGRTLFKDDILWLALSGSGIEFIFEGRYLEICMQGDDHTAAGIDLARIAVYVDKERVIDEMINSPQSRYTIIDQQTPRICTIRLLKLSEAPMSIVGIRSLVTDDTAYINSTPAKSLRIEFIGDSITCGYGIDDEDLTHTFSTATEDVTKAYAYQTALSLDADYSMVSYSGYGVYSGYVDENSDIRNVSELVPPYYTLAGFSRGTYRGETVTMTDWDFGCFEPDIVVLNLGTNDNSYCRGNAGREAEFVKCYQDFVACVRRNNPNAYILCTYGLMNCELTGSIEGALNSYRQSADDERISFLPLPTQTAADGYVVDYHPSIRTHRRAAEIITAKIREIIDQKS